MAKVSISQAAKLVGIARQNLYKNYINTGKISVIPGKNGNMIDTSELIRVFGELKSIEPDDTHLDDMMTIKMTESDMGDKDDRIIKILEQQLIEKDKLILHLQTELNHVRDELRIAHENERWLRDQIQTNKLLENKSEKKSLLGWIKDCLI